MIDLFATMPADVRGARLDAYREYVRNRDGTLDLQRRTLSRREESIARFEQAPMRVRELNRTLFAEQYARFDAKRSTPAEVMLLLTMTKINAGEAYGVNVSIDKALKQALATNDDLEVNLLVEETYHTRILLSAARMYGIQVDDVYTPPVAIRLLISAIANAPGAIARSIGTCGEIIATLLLARLLGIAREVLKHDPELRDSVEERIMEVLVDEIGHVSFNRMHMGGGSLAQTRVYLPIVAKGLATAIPELRALGASPDDVLRDINRFADPNGFPEEVRRQAFFA